MVVTGPFAAGKTEFIGAVSEIDVVSTEQQISRASEAVTKETTTVAMDFGRITVDEDLVLYLFGTPGQRRFDFMWEILSEGMLGFVVIVDSTKPETFREAKQVLSTFESYARTPYVIAANKQDQEDAWEPNDLRIVLRLDSKVKVLPCVALDKESVTILTEHGILHFETIGHGRPIVLLHGWINSWDVWRDAMMTLAGVDQRRVYALDFWGFGDSAKPFSNEGASFRLSGYVEMVHEFMDNPGIRHAPVAGHSMGGTVALKFAWRQIVGSPRQCGGFRYY